MTIAGHTFIEAPDGRRRCRDCNKAWVDVAGATKDDINRSWWCHSGVGSETEYKQVEAERDRLWELGKGA
jgi:hypothetical protein